MNVLSYLPIEKCEKKKEKKGPLGVEPFSLVHIQSGQPFVICMGL